MTHYKVTMPELGLIAGTRGMAGVGMGLLIGGLFNDRTRQVLGWTLFAVGALTTVPLALEVLGHKEKERTPELEPIPTRLGA
jgi:hypothetical protein